MSRCVVNVQGQARLLPAVPRRLDCSQLKACFVQALPKWQKGFFKNHCTGKRRGSSLFSLSQLFAVIAQGCSCWEPLSWPYGGSWQCGQSLGTGEHPFPKIPVAPCFVAFPEIIWKCFTLSKAME